MALSCFSLSRWWSMGALMGALGALSACAPTTRVILLPEPQGVATAVEVKTAAGSQTLTKPYQSAEVRKDGQVRVVQVDPLRVMERYGAMLAEAPDVEERFLLYFETGGTLLTAQSQATVPTILERARARKGGEILVIGHTDRAGSLEDNDGLSARRAQAIRDLLLAQGFDAERIEAIGRGERAPLVPTDDDIAEPRNRRVEILVR
ncbi:peptidoglycan-associated protein [Candidatus Symbiobacter mobilis CR]|uniref:Peptidoglycan-associated protein n=2 Tax=Candidatus Symbiobacter TaxID=1436289 RepID=U5NCQ8_9BURK|nr:peptidoglycan-associated protein [Candidatus Symbiobacter mobilis CR]